MMSLRKPKVLSNITLLFLFLWCNVIYASKIKVYTINGEKYVLYKDAKRLYDKLRNVEDAKPIVNLPIIIVKRNTNDKITLELKPYRKEDKEPRIRIQLGHIIKSKVITLKDIKFDNKIITPTPTNWSWRVGIDGSATYISSDFMGILKGYAHLRIWYGFYIGLSIGATTQGKFIGGINIGFEF